MREPEATTDGTCPWCGGRFVAIPNERDLACWCVKCGRPIRIELEPPTITPRRPNDE